MCLTSLSDNPKKFLSYRQRYGWKVFHYFPVARKLEFHCFSHNHSFEVPINKWIKSKEPMVSFGKRITYKPRFHIYLTNPSTKSFVTGYVRRVLFRYPVAIGYQDRQAIVVASQIKVLKVV